MEAAQRSVRLLVKAGTITGAVAVPAFGATVARPGAPTLANFGNAAPLAPGKKCQEGTCAFSHKGRRYFKVRELVAEGQIDVRWVETKDNLADLLSKGTIEPDQYEKLRAGIMHCKDSGRRFQG